MQLDERSRSASAGERFAALSYQPSFRLTIETQLSITAYLIKPVKNLADSFYRIIKKIIMAHLLLWRANAYYFWSKTVNEIFIQV